MQQVCLPHIDTFKYRHYPYHNRYLHHIIGHLHFIYLCETKKYFVVNLDNDKNILNRTYIIIVVITPLLLHNKIYISISKSIYNSTITCVPH